MNGLSEKLSSSYIPEMAIIVYRCDTDRSVYLEQRGIENGKMGAGSPLSKSCITNIISALAEDNDEIEKGFHGVIPKTLLYADTTTGKTKMVWYNPPQKRHLFFVESLGIPEGDMIMPGLVYIADGNVLSVFAFKGKHPTNRLYHAPFFNVYGDGKVCLGSARAKKPSRLTYIEAIEYWENLFWNSEFSHLIGSTPIDGNLAVITKHCIKTGEPFPTNKLNPHKTTLQQILK